MARDPLNDMYGTTLRSWDPALRGWRIDWNNPARGHRQMQIGRRIGAEIVQTGARETGQATRRAPSSNALRSESAMTCPARSMSVRLGQLGAMRK